MDTFAGIPPKWEREFPGVEEFEAAVSILAAELFIRDRIDKVLAEHGLTMAQWTIMTILHFSEQGELPLGVLAGQLRVHSTTITNAVEKMNPKGWIQRTPLDGRTTVVRLTDTGTTHLRKVQVALAEANFGFPEMTSKQLRDVAVALKPVTPTLGGGETAQATEPAAAGSSTTVT